MERSASVILLTAAHHDRAGLGAGNLVHHRFVEHTAFAVEAHHLRLEAVRLHLGLVMLHDVLNYGTNTLGVLH
jgi:hypothetical protein